MPALLIDMALKNEDRRLDSASGTHPTIQPGERNIFVGREILLIAALYSAYVYKEKGRIKECCCWVGGSISTTLFAFRYGGLNTSPYQTSGLCRLSSPGSHRPLMGLLPPFPLSSILLCLRAQDVVSNAANQSPYFAFLPALLLFPLAV